MSNLRTEFTFKELTNIAFGAPTIGPDNLTALHILMLCLLRKRQYEADIVSIDGIPAICLRKLLKKCKEPKFSFEYMDPSFKQKFDLLEKLEIRMTCLQRKYETHLERARKCQRYIKYSSTSWQEYNLQTEDIRDSDSNMGKLLENRLFINVLREKSANVVLEKLCCLELKIENLRGNLEEFRTDLIERNVLKKIDAIIPMGREIKKLDEIAKRNGALLTSAAPEIQDMLNCKVDRVILPTLTNWLKAEFPKTEDVLMNLLKIPVECVSGSVWDTNKNLCLSCGNNFTSSANNVLPFRGWNEICICQPFTKRCNLVEKIKKFRFRTYRLTHQTKTRSLHMLPVNLNKSHSTISISKYSKSWDPTRPLTASETKELSSHLNESAIFKPLVSIRLDDSKRDVRSLMRVHSVVSLNSNSFE